MNKNSIHWFRKGLRLHDNPALSECCNNARGGGGLVFPLFILDPFYANPDVVGVNRYAFLLEALQDLDESLRKRGSKLFVAQGRPEDVLLHLVDEWDVKLITFEGDTEPYASVRDNNIKSLFSPLSSSKSSKHKDVKLSVHWSHTLFPMEAYIAKCGSAPPPTTYVSFLKLFSANGKPRLAIDAPKDFGASLPKDYLEKGYLEVPTLQSMGYTETPTSPFKGGETNALKRLEETCVERMKWVCKFEKPNTSPNSLHPTTTVLSPYLKFGCLSASKFYHTLESIYSHDPQHTIPPVSLHGQLLWREFFYFSGVTTANFDKMIGNPRCKQIPWDRNAEKILAWKEGRTGFPFIDAIMTQLRVEGWIHHLARHAVACFLTRGDLWQHWEEGAKVFDLYLLDADWALNNANWQWLSCSNFFYQYFRCYSPIAFGQKTDPDGLYIKKWLPQLSKYPSKYIFEPWKASAAQQREWGCVIGKDYPLPIVKHDVAVKENMNKMKAAYDNQGGAASSSSGGGEDGDGVGVGGGSSNSSSKSKVTGDNEKKIGGSSDNAASSTDKRKLNGSPNVKITSFMKKKAKTDDL